MTSQLQLNKSSCYTLDSVALKELIVEFRNRSKEDEPVVGLVDQSIHEIWQCVHYAGVEFNDLSLGMIEDQPKQVP